MNKHHARYLFVRAGILFFLVCLALKERPAKEPSPDWSVAVPERIQVPATEASANDNESYLSPVPFDQLQEENPDIIGWLSVEGTNINGSILQSEDNIKYLAVGYDGNENPAGAIFLDYECSGDFSGQHNIIYGHNMKNGMMFHDFVNFKQESYFKKHQNIIVYTPDKEIHLSPISIVCTESDGKRRITKFSDRTDFERYVKTMLEGGLYQEEQTGDMTRLWSFVTCSYEFDNARTILYARECDP